MVKITLQLSDIKCTEQDSWEYFQSEWMDSGNSDSWSKCISNFKEVVLKKKSHLLIHCPQTCHWTKNNHNKSTILCKVFILSSSPTEYQIAIMLTLVQVGLACSQHWATIVSQFDFASCVRTTAIGLLLQSTHMHGIQRQRQFLINYIIIGSSDHISDSFFLHFFKFWTCLVATKTKIAVET